MTAVLAYRVPPPVILTRHADRRREEFGLTTEDLGLILHEAEVIRTTRMPHNADSRSWRQRRIYARGEWALVVDDRGLIITVLRKTTEVWSHDPDA